MKLQHLFSLNFFIAIFFGISLIFFTVPMGWAFGLEPTESANWSTRLPGGSILGFATLMWFGRKTTVVEADGRSLWRCWCRMLNF